MDQARSTTAAELYPNPTNGKVIIQTAGIILNGNNCKVFDASGKEYLPKSWRRLSTYSMELDLTGLSKGIYFIRFNNGDHYTTLSVVKK